MMLAPHSWKSVQTGSEENIHLETLRTEVQSIRISGVRTEDLQHQSEVFDFYQCHWDKFIRKNDKLWIDFCKTFEDPVTNRCILNSTQGQVI